MPNHRTRRLFLKGSATAGVVALAGCTGGDDPEEEPTDDDQDDDHDDETEVAGYEVWALDQGTDTIYIYEPHDDHLDLEETIDVNGLEGVPDSGVIPHMIDYTSDYSYAAVACTGGARVLVFDTESKELIGNIETGPGSHFASFSPDDDYLTVDVIGENRIAKVEADLEAGEFEETDEIVLEGVENQGEANDPVCHQFDGHGRSIHTLGPSYHDAGVVVVDHEDFSIDTSWSDEELPANCGTVPHPTEDKFYLTAGLPTPTDDDGEPVDGEEGVGSYYVLDTSGDEVELIDEGDTGGIDAHGFWFPSSGDELWVLNRETNDGVIVDPDTDEVVEDIDAFGPAQSDDINERDAPDIMWASPDGEYMFTTLRGPAPLSGDPHAATGVTPGFSVIDIASREIEEVVEPDPIDDYSEEDIEDDDVPVPDFHGIGVRPLGEYDTEIPTSPSY